MMTSVLRICSQILPQVKSHQQWGEGSNPQPPYPVASPFSRHKTQHRPFQASPSAQTVLVSRCRKAVQQLTVSDSVKISPQTGMPSDRWSNDGRHTYGYSNSNVRMHDSNNMHVCCYDQRRQHNVTSSTTSTIWQMCRPASSFLVLRQILLTYEYNQRPTNCQLMTKMPFLEPDFIDYSTTIIIIRQNSGQSSDQNRT